MAKLIRYFSTLQLKDTGYPEQIQILRVGEWSHPFYGDFEITDEDLKLFKENFDKKVRRVDIALDAEHYPEKGAAAWFKELVIEGKELYAQVEWTDWGRELLDKKQFKYISPEFDFDYKDDESGEKYSNVLFGAALTNRPFIKDMQPVLMSEGIEKEAFAMLSMKQKKTETKNGRKQVMDLKDILALIGLKEDASLEDVKTAVTAMQQGSQLFSEVVSKLELAEGATVEDVTKKFSEAKKVGEGKVALTEDEVKQLKEDAEDGKKALAQLKLNERDRAVEASIRSGKITPAQKEWADKYALNDPEGFKTFSENAPVVVKTDEQGSSEGGQANLDGKKEEEQRTMLHEKTKEIMNADSQKSYKVALAEARAALKI